VFCAVVFLSTRRAEVFRPAAHVWFLASPESISRPLLIGLPAFDFHSALIFIRKQARHRSQIFLLRSLEGIVFSSVRAAPASVLVVHLRFGSVVQHIFTRSVVDFVALLCCSLCAGAFGLCM
jgi:hypothetical protein